MRRLGSIFAWFVMAAAALWVAPEGIVLKTTLTIFSRMTADSGVAVERAVPYGPQARQLLDIYKPSSPASGAPIILFVYGGSFRNGDRGMYGFVGSALAARGITAVIPDYRLYPEARFPTFIDDAALAYQYAARVLAGGEKNRTIIVMGHSAGAYIAAMLALNRAYIDKIDPELPRPAGLIGLAGPYSFDLTTWPRTVDVFATASSVDETRPIVFAGPDAPPALLMHGLADDTVRLFNTRDLAATLTQAGVMVDKIEPEGLGHYGIIQSFARGFRWRSPVLETVVAFAGRTVKR